MVVWSNLFTWNNFATLVFTIIGAIIYIRMWGYIRKENQSSPKDTFWQRTQYYISNFLYSIMTALSIVFVLAVVTSTLSINALFLAKFAQEIRIEAIAALQFPRFIPITLMLITGFAIIYPFYEYLLLARRSREAPMELQQWVEIHIIDRVSPPFTYLLAIVMFFIIVIAVPIVMAYFTLNVIHIPGLDLDDVPPRWIVALIFADWTLIGPIFYLSYYAQSGTGHYFFQGIRSNVRVDAKTPLMFVIAVISYITTFNGFIDIVPILWGKYPEAVTNPAENRGGALEQFIYFLFESSQLASETDLFRLRLFFGVVPIDFLLFIITTALFGLIGFRNKFLNKESLNRPAVIIFAAYLITGIAFSIFVNAMVRWPYIFPGQFLPQIGLNLDFTNPVDQQIFIRLLSPAILMEKTFNLVFLIYFIFINKEIRRSTDELVLGKAILKQDLPTISRFARHKNPEMRKMVANSLVYYIRLKDTLDKKQSRYMAQILSDFITDKNQTILEIIERNLDLFLPKIAPKDLVFMFGRAAKVDDSQTLAETAKILAKVAELDIEIYKQVFKELTNVRMSSSAQKALYATLTPVAKKDRDFVTQMVMPMLAKIHPMLTVSALQIIAVTIDVFEDYYPIFVKHCGILMQQKELTLVTKALNVYSLIAIKDTPYSESFISDFQVAMRAYSKNSDFVREGIGALSRVIVNQPFRFDTYFPLLESFFKNASESTRADLLLSLGSISTVVSSTDVFFARIFPYIAENIKDSAVNVRKSLISTILLIAKTRPDLAEDQRFHLIFRDLLRDPDKSNRYEIHEYLENADPFYFVNDIIDLLTQNIELEYRIDLLLHLLQIAPQIGPKIQESQVIQVLLGQSFGKTNRFLISGRMMGLIPGSYSIYETSLGLLSDKDTPEAGYTVTDETPDIVISVMGATVAVLTAILNVNESIYPQVEGLLTTALLENDDLACARIVKFYTFESVMPQHQRALPITPESTLNVIINHISQAGPVTLNTIAYCLNLFYSAHSDWADKLLMLGQQTYKVAKYPDPNTIKSLLTLFGQILYSQADTYFPPTLAKKGPDQKKLLKELIMPLLKDYTQSNYLPVQEAITQFIAKLSQIHVIEKDIRNYLLDTLATTKNLVLQRTIIKSLAILPDANVDNRLIRPLVILLQNKAPEIQIEAIHTMGILMRQFPPFKKEEKSTPFRYFKKLVFATFTDRYKPELSVEIKKAILAELNIVLMKQPFSPNLLIILKQMGLDPEINIAMDAVKLFFQYYDRFPEQSTIVLEYFYYYSSNPKVHLLLAQKIQNLYKTSKNIDPLIPTLIKLVASEQKEVRELALSTFQTAYYQDPKSLAFSLNFVLKLIKERNSEIRADAVRILLDIIILNPSKMKTNRQIFNTLQILAKDPDIKVRRIIAEAISRLIQQVSQQMNYIMQLIYTFTRESDDTIIQSISFALKVLKKEHAERLTEIKTHLKRVERKTHNAQLNTLIEELETH